MPESRQFVESIGRGFKLLSLVCQSASPLSLSELSKESHLSISTIQRLSYTLQRLGLLDRDLRTKKFKIGPEMISLSFAVIDNLTLKKIAYPYMKELSQQVGEVVGLAALSGDRVILIESIKTQQILNVNTNSGVIIPPHATASGKAILAFLPEDEIDLVLRQNELEKLTDYTITSVQTYKNTLPDVRKCGFATAVDEDAYGLSAVAAPIQGNTGEVRAALTLMVPTARINKKKLVEVYSRKVIQAAERISFDMGYRK
jgi:IclR family transcriptional regulator, KDG regulon repressor